MFGRTKYDWARFESYGFFTDIDDDTWRRHQQRAQTALHIESLYYNQSYPNDQADTNPAAWLMMNVHPFFTCPNLRRVGGHGDGAKWTCDPHRFVQQSDCLIYSFGSSGSYTFEDTIAYYRRNGPHPSHHDHTCEIHVFDPEPSYARVNDTIVHNIHYHAWALQSSRVRTTTTNTKKRKYQWQLASQYKNLYEIIQELGHDNRRIDVLKIDCEGCEWTTYQDWLFTSNNSNTTHPVVRADIRQILIETHAVPDPNVIAGGPPVFFDALIQNHYVLFSKEANTHPGARPYGLFYEWSWLKLHPNFFG